mmetsp:Transcript_64636/g.127784  ORF Transcript_64636/g.127784 Transcript_64636/m.127784 type:complete len:278 (+) Transcript_64636:124-957(+)
MGAGLSDSFQCCVSRKEGRSMPPPQYTTCRAAGALSGNGHILTGNAIKAVPATTPRSNGDARDGQVAVAHCVLQEQIRADRSAQNATASATSVANRSIGAEDATRHCETTCVEAKNNTNAIEGETQGSPDVPRVREVGGCDAWTTLEVLTHCNSLSNWYCSGSGCKNDISASGQQIAQQEKANRSLSNWYTGNMSAELVLSLSTSTMAFPALVQYPCHYYNLSSHVDEPAVSNCDETDDGFCMVQGSQTQIEGSVTAMNMWHPVAACHSSQLWLEVS